MMILDAGACPGRFCWWCPISRDRLAELRETLGTRHVDSACAAANRGATLGGPPAAGSNDMMTCNIRIVLRLPMDVPPAA